jgi:hypothetical protein
MRRATLPVALGPLAAATAMLAAALPPPAAVANNLVQGQRAIALLNQQRAANGIPPVTENQRFATAWCPAEDSGPSGGEVARVLSPFVLGWSATSSPWHEAPLHQQAMYNPAYTEAGDSDVDGQACMGLGAPIEEPALPAFFAFTSEAGPQDVPTSETVDDEAPFAPQELVGIPQGKRTGGQIFVYAEGIGEEAEPVSWTLAETEGTTIGGVRMAAERQAQARGASGYLSDVGVLVPPVLRPETGYVLTVAWRGNTKSPETQTVSFHTGLASNVLSLYVRGNFLYGESEAPGGALTLLNGHSRLKVPLGARPVNGLYRGRLALARLHAGRWLVCISSGGHGSLFSQSRRCGELPIR